MFVATTPLKLSLVGSHATVASRGGRCAFLGDAVVSVAAASLRGERCRGLPIAGRLHVRMGLNASKLKKQQQQQQGKKKNKVSTKQEEASDAPSQIDTNRRDYMFQMLRVSKILPNGKQILKDISLAFFPGAKIGVVGPNGAGKSTLLRIMAGVDKEFEGEARPMRTASIGYLAQEPQLDDGETVMDNIMAGVKEIRDNLHRLETLSQRLADPACSAAEKQEIAQEIDQVQAR
jgi:ABC-type uncharacterized transport system fused permease/ATPase subunit